VKAGSPLGNMALQEAHRRQWEYRHSRSEEKEWMAQTCLYYFTIDYALIPQHLSGTQVTVFAETHEWRELASFLQVACVDSAVSGLSSLPIYAVFLH
jgi:hypothetical protein